MNTKTTVNSILRRLGWQLVSTRRIGLEIFNEINRTDVRVKIILDVGANVGQSSRAYLQQFSEAEVHAFEPVEANFTKLRQIANSKLVINKMAVGSETGSLRIFLSQNPSKHSSVVVEDRNHFEDVEMVALDDYCARRQLGQVGLLKIDTEGADLKVLQGATGMLQRQAIDFVLVETAFYHKQRHVYLCRFLEQLSHYGYNLLGIYDQTFEWNRAARISHANALFARKGLYIE